MNLDSAFCEANGTSRSVHHLVPTVEVEILDIDLTVEAKDIAEVVWSCLREEPSSCVEVSLTKRPFRGIRKAFVKMEEARALKLLEATHIKIGWVSCRVRRKTEIKRCYRCLGFGHMAADCRGPDHSRSFWKCGEEGHTAGTCTRNPWCYLCTIRDHIPGTMRCVAFRVAAPNRKPPRGCN